MSFWSFRVRPLRVLLPLGVVGALLFGVIVYLDPGPSKTKEARDGVTRIYDQARDFYLEKGRFPARSAGPTPPLGACCQSGESECSRVTADWDEAGWKELGFSLEPQYFSFAYQPTQTSDGRPAFYARAFGDLDCNGIYSTFQMYGEVRPGAE